MAQPAYIVIESDNIVFEGTQKECNLFAATRGITAKTWRRKDWDKHLAVEAAEDHHVVYSSTDECHCDVHCEHVQMHIEQEHHAPTIPLSVALDLDEEARLNQQQAPTLFADESGVVFYHTDDRPFRVQIAGYGNFYVDVDGNVSDMIGIGDVVNTRIYDAEFFMQYDELLQVDNAVVTINGTMTTLLVVFETEDVVVVEADTSVECCRALMFLSRENELDAEDEQLSIEDMLAIECPYVSREFIQDTLRTIYAANADLEEQEEKRKAQQAKKAQQRAAQQAMIEKQLRDEHAELVSRFAGMKGFSISDVDTFVQENLSAAMDKYDAEQAAIQRNVQQGIAEKVSKKEKPAKANRAIYDTFSAPKSATVTETTKVTAKELSKRLSVILNISSDKCLPFINKHIEAVKPCAIWNEQDEAVMRNAIATVERRIAMLEACKRGYLRDAFLDLGGDESDRPFFVLLGIRNYLSTGTITKDGDIKAVYRNSPQDIINRYGMVCGGAPEVLTSSHVGYHAIECYWSAKHMLALLTDIKNSK